MSTLPAELVKDPCTAYSHTPWLVLVVLRLDACLELVQLCSTIRPGDCSTDEYSSLALFVHRECMQVMCAEGLARYTGAGHKKNGKGHIKGGNVTSSCAR